MLYARKPILERNCETEGIFSPVAGILGSLQANEVLKTIIGLKNSLDNQMMIFDSIKINLRKVKLSFNPNVKINVKNFYIFFFFFHFRVFLQMNTF